MIRSLIIGALLTLGCTVSPVISGDPTGGHGSDLYNVCRRAAKDYCRYVSEAPDDEMKACVARSTYECVSARK